MNDGLGRAQHVLLIGGTSCIGTATVRALLANGDARTVTLAGRDPESLARTADVLRLGRTADIHVVGYDAADSPAQVTAMIDDSVRRSGDIDVTLICVGSLPDQRRLDTDTAAAEHALHVNMVAPAVAAHVAADRCVEQGHGTVVVLSSAAAVRPRRSLYAYGAAKAGLDAYALGLAERLRGSGAGVMVVRPGHVRTRMTEGRSEPPLSVAADRVAAAIIAGLRREATVVWVPQAIQPVMLGLRHMPRPLLRRLPI